jgi:hypothetical protein
VAVCGVFILAIFKAPGSSPLRGQSACAKRAATRTPPRGHGPHFDCGDELLWAARAHGKTRDRSCVSRLVCILELRALLIQMPCKMFLKRSSPVRHHR